MQWKHHALNYIEMWIKLGSACKICMSICPFSQGGDPKLPSQMNKHPDMIRKIRVVDKEKHGRRALMKEAGPDLADPWTLVF